MKITEYQISNALEYGANARGKSTFKQTLKTKKNKGIFNHEGNEEKQKIIMMFKNTVNQKINDKSDEGTKIYPSIASIPSW